MTDVTESRREIDWVNTSFLAVFHLLFLYAIYHVSFLHFSWWSFSLGLVWMYCSGMSITGGYHRLFAHRAYKCNTLLKVFYLFFGAAGVQNSAIKWCADHREHHGHTDEEGDPYNIQKGFWWAHMGWIFFKDDEIDVQKLVPDLLRDPYIAFQNKYYVWIAILANGIIPIALGSLWGDPLGAFLWAGCIRLVVQYHATFSINSVAHYIGTQPYSTRNSAKDSVITALITFGEGYHNYHHRFPTDYRNGIKAFHFDPTKWWVWGLSKIGVTWDLKRIPDEKIERAKEAVKNGNEKPHDVSLSNVVNG